MTEYFPGDVLTTAQAQADLIRVQAPIVEGLAYSIVVNGKPFHYLALPGDEPTDVGAGLAAGLLEGQTYLAVLLDETDVFVAGPVGEGYSIGTPLGPELLEVLPVQDPLPARPVGRLRVISKRAIWTKTRDHPEPFEKVYLTVRRELEGPVDIPGADQIETTSPVFQIDARDIRTVLSRASTGRTSVFESIVLPE